MQRSLLRTLALPLLLVATFGTACGHGKKKKQDDKHEHKPGDGHDHDHKPGDGHDHGSTGTK